MSKGVKIGCAIVAVLFLISIAVCTAGYFLARDWFEGVGEEYAAKQPQMEAEARQIAQGGAEACVDDGLRRHTACGDLEIRCQVDASLRTSMCLQHSNPPSAFCDDVPASTEIIAVATWGAQECQRRGLQANARCPQFFSKTIAGYCARARDEGR